MATVTPISTVRAVLDAANTPAATLALTNILQGAEADPTKIGAEYMPDAISLDWILPGESADGILPTGSLTRQGAVLYIHDNATPGGVAVSGESNNNATGGRVISLPYGTTVSDVASSVKKPTSGTRYYQELGRVTIHGSKLIVGNRISMVGWIRVFSDTNGAITTSHIFIIPAIQWDAGGELGGLLSGSAPQLPYIRTFNAASRDVECRFWMSALIVSAGSIPSDTDPSGIYARGYDYTNSTDYSDSGTGGTLDNMIALGTSTEFVVVHRTGAAETRQFEFQLTLEAKAP